MYQVIYFSIAVTVVAVDTILDVLVSCPQLQQILGINKVKEKSLS